MNTENSKTNKHVIFRLALAGKLNVKDPSKNMESASLSIYYTWENIKSACSITNFNISAPTWNNAFDLPDGSYSIINIQDDFEFIIKKHKTLAENPPG